MRLSALRSRCSLRCIAVGSALLALVLSAVLAAGCGSSPSSATSAPPSSPLPSVTAPATTVTAIPPPGGVAASASAPTSPRLTRQVTSFVGSAAPDFRFKLFQGEESLGKSELNLSEVAGQPIVLNFWARFCGPCWSEMPELQDFFEERGDRLQMLGIDVGQFTGLGSPKDAGKLLDALGITYPAGYTDDASVVSKYRIRAMPTTVFIDSDGVVFHSWTGAINRQQLDAVVARMLAEE